VFFITISLYKVLPTCWQGASAVAYGLYPQSQDIPATRHFGRSSYYIGIRTISNAITRSHLARSYPGIGQKHLDPRDGYTPPSPGKIRGLINKKPPGMVTAVRVELTRGVLSIHFALFKGVPTVRYSASSHCQETISLFYS
jgi:hypothetical protein